MMEKLIQSRFFTWGMLAVALIIIYWPRKRKPMFHSLEDVFQYIQDWYGEKIEK